MKHLLEVTPHRSNGSPVIALLRSRYSDDRHEQNRPLKSEQFKTFSGYAKLFWSTLASKSSASLTRRTQKRKSTQTHVMCCCFATPSMMAFGHGLPSCSGKRAPAVGSLQLEISIYSVHQRMQTPSCTGLKGPKRSLRLYAAPRSHPARVRPDLVRCCEKSWKL